MIPGHLYIGYDLTHVLDCGIVKQVQDMPAISLSQTPIPTYPAENAFTFDTGAVDQLTFSLTRVNPDDAYDPSDDYRVIHGRWDIAEAPTDQWCNRLWIEALVSLINRWQFRTDGCRLTFLPVVEGDVFQHTLDEINVYLKTVTHKYTRGFAEKIDVTITAIVGSATGLRQEVV